MKKELKKIVENRVRLSPTYKFIKPYKKLIFKQTNFLPYKTRFPERIFCVINNIKEIKNCKCGKKLPFNPKRFKYDLYCSSKCIFKLNDIISDNSIKKLSYVDFKKQYNELVEKYNYDFANVKRFLFKNKEVFKTYELKFKKYSFSQLYFNLKNDLKEIPKCLICNINNQTFWNYKSGYSGVCSKSCGNAIKHQRYKENKENNINISDEELCKLIKKQIKSYNSNNFYYIFQKKFSFLIGNIYKRTEYLDINVQFTERIYHIVNNLFLTPLCSICNNKKLKFNTYLNGYREYCSKCSRKNVVDKNTINVRNCNFQIYFDYLAKNKDYECLTLKEEFIETGILKIKHLDCGKKYERKIDFLRGCPFCLISKSERDISKFIFENIKEKIINGSKPLIFPNGNKYEIDILIPSKNIGIEFDGLYWHSELIGKDKKYHLLKTDLAKEQNIQLIHVFENEWINKKDIVKSVILSKLGIYDKRIYARKCEIREIDAKTKNEFLINNHLQGKDNSKYKIGLFYNNELITVMTFGKRKITGGKVQTELIRFCSKQNTQIIGGANKLFKFYLRNFHNGEKIITYADRRYSNGTFYEKLGFKLDHISPPNYWYSHIQDRLNLFHRVNFQKHKLKDKLEIFDENLTEWENMQNNGWDRIWDCGNYVFHY